MLTIVRSSIASIGSEPQSLPAGLPDLLIRLQEAPQRCQWIVPTGRRRRALVRTWLRTDQRQASLLPGLHTLQSFTELALQYSPKQWPQIGAAERLLRVARAWQQVMGRSAGDGLIGQLDRFIRDWQACHLDVPAKPADVFERLVEHYCNDLKADQRLDQHSGLRLLVDEVSDPDSWPNRLLLNRIDLLLFDGFHRFDRLELELIAALSNRRDILAWLVGIPGQVSCRTMDWAVQYLHARARKVLVVDHSPSSVAPMAGLGRSLFPEEPTRIERKGPLPGLYRLDADNSTLEVEAVAKRIKSDYLALQATDQPLRLCDIAVVIPGPDYDPLVREIFPRAGLEFNLAGQALHVSGSRPARVLVAALQLIYGHWRHDLLCDFLNLPLVKRRLQDAHRLYDLFEHRPRARRQLDHRAWQEAWDHHLQKLRGRIDRWASGELELPEQTLLSLEEFVAKQRDLADSLERLIASIKVILQPLAAIAALLDGATTLDELTRPCLQLLGLLQIDKWLTPRKQEREPGERQYEVAIPWVEYEKDQKAYSRLLGILQALPAIPIHRLPLTSNGRLDAVAALQLALDSETYQIKTEDDAGVQLFEMRELRGLQFRHVYVLGLVDGQIPRVPEEGLLADRRRRTPALAEQLQQKEAEVTHLFSQLFEAAQERLVLAFPGVDAYEKTRPSRFLVAVQERVHLPSLEPATITAGMREATIRLGRAARTVDNKTSLCPPIELKEIAAGLAKWQMRKCGPDGIRIEAGALLQTLFPDTRAFSPSELETYAACPFRYFGSRVLKLEERDPNRMRGYYGSLVHRVFQTFYTEMRQLLAIGDDDPLPAIDRRYGIRLIQLFEAEWDQLEDGTLPPDLKNLFACDEGVLHLFIDAMAMIEAEHGNLLNEFVLQNAEGTPVLLGHDKHDRPVLLSGKIDRVDVHRTQRTRAIILDYKTGRNKPPKERRDKAEDGRMLQLPLYGAALKQVRRELEIVGGAYIHVSERLADARKAVAAAGELPNAGGKHSEVPFDVEGTRRLALELVGEIRDGNFSWTRHTFGRPHTECTSWCEMKHACRHPDGYQTFERY
jgi:PD-(D/E)XK nuclease superfamily/Exodeoxyribonuclease V, gamma subunit